MFITRTEIDIKQSNKEITHKNKIMLLGSCFAENVGSLLLNDKFLCITNPFGVLYNPISVLNALKDTINCKIYKQKQLTKNGNLWCSFSHHSSFSSVNPEKAIQKINQQVQLAHNHFSATNFLFITFGTARVYRFIQTNSIVSNCHKFGREEFNQELLSVKDIVNDYSVAIAEILKQKPDLQIIFTLSPVRHLKDGFVENMQSKAILHLAIQELVAKFDNCSYFPAYEVFMDDLRDYRYYADDLIHPRTNGINYLYQKFSDSYYSNDTKNALSEIRKIKQALSHRPLTDDEETINQFRKNIVEKAKKFEVLYGIDFSDEISLLSQ
jgi:hypothetical protein